MRKLILAACIAISPAAAAQQGQPRPSTCPLAAHRAATAAAVPAAAEDRSCLVSAGAIGDRDIYDVRSRGEFLRFHVPGARHATPSSLPMTRRGDSRAFVAYDSGKSRSATFLLCSRLRRAGLAHVRLIDGGIAAWAQAHDPGAALAVSRLSDAEVAAALSDPKVRATALDKTIKSVLAEHRIGAGSAAKAGRHILVADVSTPLATLESRLAATKGTAFYWTGTPDRLRELIHAHLLIDQKRVAGPAQSATCSAL